MDSVFAKVLALACSFLLALPQGWCCMIGFGCHNVQSTAQVESTAGTRDIPSDGSESCPFCSHSPSSTPNGNQGPAKERNPSEVPSTPAKPVCCCSPDSQIIVPTSLAVEQADSGLVAILPSVNLVARGAGRPTFLCGTDRPPTTFSILILKCVWLC